MVVYELDPPVTISGQLLSDLEDAAYAIRQTAIAVGDHQAWQLAQRLRRATSVAEAQVAKMELQAWLS